MDALIGIIIDALFWSWLFSEKRRGKVRNALSRVERIERICDWRDRRAH
jgi:hypothetical protein